MARKSAVIHHHHSNHSELKIITDILIAILIFAAGFAIGLGYKHFQKDTYKQEEDLN